MKNDVESLDEARQARIAKRKELFARVHEVAKDLPSDLPDPLTLLHEGRRERDEQLMSVLRETDPRWNDSRF